MKEIKENPHVIIIAYPLQGHVIPSANLALKLASDYSFTITFVNTEFIHHQISKARNRPLDEDIFTEARESGLDIRYAVISDGFPLGFDRSLNHDQFFEGFMHVFPAHVDDFMGKLVREDPTVSCMIVDTFFVWPSMIARKYNLVNISFFTEPALVLTLYYHVELLRKNGHFGSKGNRTDAIDYIPGVNSIMPSDLMSYLQAKDDINTTVHRIIYKAFDDVKLADFIICNTVQEFEEGTISALNREQPFYAIGPIFPPGLTGARISTSLWVESDCTQWLNSKPCGSVLYVSFGSYAHTSKQEIEEIAYGLMLSGAHFIWVLRPDIVSSDETDILPADFEKRVEGRGLVVTWCSQTDVLAHPAVGGFLTHCGWNSILESTRCCVPLICYPLLTDQFTNRKLAVEDLGIGINLCEGESILSRKEVSEKINCLMGGEKSEEIRGNVKKVRRTLEDAIAGNGSSVKNFDFFVKDLKALVSKKKGCVIKRN